MVSPAQDRREFELGDEKEKRKCAQLAASPQLKSMAVKGDSSFLPHQNFVLKTSRCMTCCRLRSSHVSALHTCPGGIFMNLCVPALLLAF